VVAVAVLVHRTREVKAVVAYFQLLFQLVVASVVVVGHLDLLVVLVVLAAVAVGRTHLLKLELVVLELLIKVLMVVMAVLAETLVAVAVQAKLEMLGGQDLVEME
jgi:hypothetical protein